MADPELSTLTLRYDVLENGPDWPVVTILIDGRDRFADVGNGWRGFDPDDILGRRSPLLPDGSRRRVAVYCCLCGDPGCGALAPVVLAPPDRSRVVWSDFRDFNQGIFGGPVTERVADRLGKPVKLPELHFDREQYVVEVERATRDRSWETPRRRTARLLAERIASAKAVPPPGFSLGWIGPRWNGAGVDVAFEHATGRSDQPAGQRILHLASDQTDPRAAADEMFQQLRAMAPSDWAQVPGAHPHA